MLPTGHLLAFALLSAALIVIPGPNVLFVISRALQLGRAAGLAAVVGGLIGVYVQVIAVALGIGALVERSVAVFTVIKLAGAAYLVYLGVQAVRHRRSLAAALEARVAAKTTGAMLRDGFAVGVSNPKAIVFFAAVLPQFADRGRPRAGSATAARRGFCRDRAGLGQHVGCPRGYRALMVRPVAAAPRADRRHRRPDHDRHRREPGPHRPQGLTRTV